MYDNKHQRQVLTFYLLDVAYMSLDFGAIEHLVLISNEDNAIYWRSLFDKNPS